MTAFNEKKEADLSGKRNTNSRGPRKSNNTDRKGKSAPKTNGANGNGATASNGDEKAEDAEETSAQVSEKEGTPEVEA
jgi:hypothetical protein